MPTELFLRLVGEHSAATTECQPSPEMIDGCYPHRSKTLLVIISAHNLKEESTTFSKCNEKIEV